MANDDDVDDGLLSEEEASPLETPEELAAEAEAPPAGSDAAIEAQFAGQPFRVVYQTNNFLLPQIKDLIIEGDDVNIRPEYQRRLRWSYKQKSLLVESLLLNVPVPPVFFFENDLASYEVMDGQQRLNAIKEFLSGDFRLRGLTVLSSLNGRTYSKLPPRVRRGLDRASVSAIVLLQESQGKLKRAGTNKHYELRRFVFERLNTGGKRLSAQEIRNAVYGGLFNNMIVRLSRDEVFTRVWGIPPYTKSDPNDYYEEKARQNNSLYRKMDDCQLVLRFFALDNDEHIRGSMRAMLDRCMERNIDFSQEQFVAEAERYLSRLHFADKLFDGRPFNLSSNGKDNLRPIAGIYDGVMLAIDSLWKKRNKLYANKALLLADYKKVVSMKAHTGALTGSANTAADIRGRIKIFKDLFLRHV